MTWNNGDIYIGEWKNDNKEGDGIFLGKKGGIFEGKWKNDKLIKIKKTWINK